MASRTTLQYGSNGSDVKDLQKYLNNNGYKLDVDGIFGDNTLSAVKDYQKNNGLSVDGIVGTNTWGKLLGSNTSTNSSGYTPTVAPTIAPTPNGYKATAAPTLAPTPDTPTYDTSTWDDSEKGSAAGAAYEAAKNALNNQQKFTFSENEWLNSVKDHIENYGDFTYDVNSDALYQQYADQYTRQGKMASADAMGQAAAMTGGYGNSYAATVGNQAYQSYIQQLNDKIPELYQLALDRHNMGKQDLYNQYSMLLSEYEREYGLHSDEYNKLLDSLGIAKDDYYSGADMFYNEQTNKNNMLNQGFNDAMAIWSANNDNAWKQAEWDESLNQYANEEAWRTWEANTNNAWEQAKWDEGLNQYANDETWRQKEYELNDRQVTLQEQEYEDSKKANNSSEDSSGGSNNKAYTTKSKQDLLKNTKLWLTGTESAEDYADWDYADWEGYFATIRSTEGKSAAEEELSRMNKRGYIPKNFITAAAIGARGSLGH